MPAGARHGQPTPGDTHKPYYGRGFRADMAPLIEKSCQQCGTVIVDVGMGQGKKRFCSGACAMRYFARYNTSKDYHRRQMKAAMYNKRLRPRPKTIYGSPFEEDNAEA